MLRLITLGGLTIENGRLANGGANLRSRLVILAVLAVARERGLRRDKLLALFWPESDEERARNALRQALFALRRELGLSEITTGVADLRLNTETVSADVIEFESAIRNGRLEDAVALYRGPFLDGVFVRDTPELERWIDEQRQRLSGDYGRALESLAAAAATRGDRQGAAAWLERRVLQDPYSSRTARHYMEALVAAGHREAAIQHGDVHAALVREELGAEPDADVLALTQSLRAGSFLNATAAVRPSDLSSASSVDGESSGYAASSRPAARLAPRTRSRRQQHVLATLTAVLVVGVAVFVTARKPATPIDYAIAPIHNQTGDSFLTRLSEMAGASITRQVVQGGRASVVELQGFGDSGANSSAHQSLRNAREAGATNLVSGEMYKRGDSILVEMQIVDAKHARVVHQLDPVIVPMANAYSIVERLRDGVAGAIASLADTLYQPWFRAHSRPPTYTAFQEFVQGLNSVVYQSSEDAFPHFKRAAELDTTFVEAKLWLLEAQDTGSTGAYNDSIAAAALRQRSKLAPFDQAALDRALAFREGRWEDAYDAARRMVAAAPTTQDAQLFLAQTSMATRRYAEAIDALGRTDLHRGWLKDMSLPVFWLLQANHLLGEYTKALEISNAVRTGHFGDDRGICIRTLDDYAALGRERAVDSLVATCGTIAGGLGIPNGPYFHAGQEYIVHGFPDAGRSALTRALDAFTRAAATRPGARYNVAQAQAALGDWQGAYQTYRAIADTSVYGRSDLAIAAAHIGDTSAVSSTLQLLEVWSKRERRFGEDKEMMAFIMLARGDRDRAVVLLQQAQAEGIAPAWKAWHQRFELWPLRGDPRFEALVRPRR
jgi:DNA-binding SARP family transcriptional activator